MEKISIFISIIASLVVLGQYLQIKKLKKNWSLDKEWYKNKIPRDLKENLIYQLDWWMGRRNIKVQDFLKYIDQENKELEDIVEIVLDKTSISKLYLPGDMEKVVITEGRLHHPYRIGRTMRMKDLLSGYQGSTKEYSYKMDDGLDVEFLEEILNSKEEFKNRNFCHRFYFFLSMKSKLYVVDVSWFDLDPMSWWMSKPKSINNISGDMLNNYINKGDILFLPKKIN